MKKLNLINGIINKSVDLLRSGGRWFSVRVGRRGSARDGRVMTLDSQIMEQLI